MKISPIVLQIRSQNTTFGNNVAGAAELAVVEKQTFSAERAFVLQLAESSAPNDQDAGNQQLVSENFGILVALDNRADKRGQTAHDRLFDIRSELWGAILYWRPPGIEDPISYIGGRVHEMNRAYLWYLFEFRATTRITDADGFEETYDKLLTVNSKYDIVNDIEQTDAEDTIILDGPP